VELGQAADYTQIKADLQTAVGTILMPIGDEYLIDLDASSNLNQGDIVTLLTDGEKIIQPITKEIIGTVERPRGFFKVTKIKSGYSYIKPISENLSPKKGDKISRYDQVPTRLVLSADAEQQKAAKIKATLNQFNWLEDSSLSKALLIFKVTDNQLTITDSNNNMLYQYELRDNKAVPLYKPKNPVTHVYTDKSTTGILNTAFEAIVGTVSPDRMKLMDPKSGAIRPGHETMAGAWSSPTIKGNPVGIAVADFDGDGSNEIAIALQSQLFISRVIQQKYRQLSEIKIPKGLKLLSIETADLDKNGSPEIYITAASGDNLRSLAIRYTSGDYVVFAKDLPWYLRSVYFPERGKLLIGQKRGPSGNHFIGQPFRINLRESNLSDGEAIQLPHGINLFAFTPFLGGKNMLYYAYLNVNGKLSIITSQGLEVWQSNDAFGGSEINIDTTENSKSDIVEPTFIQPRIVTTEKGEIIVIQNFGPRILARGRFFTRNRVVGLKWDGLSLVEKWSTPKRKGYLADFAVADMNNDGENEVTAIVQMQRGNLIQAAKSIIFSYKLNQ